MIKTIIYVEEGSVDVDLLEAEVGDETRVIEYRKGSTPPKVEQFERPIANAWDCRNQRMENKFKKLLVDIFNSKTTPKTIKNKANEIFVDYFD